MRTIEIFNPLLDVYSKERKSEAYRELLNRQIVSSKQIGRYKTKDAPKHCETLRKDSFHVGRNPDR